MEAKLNETIYMKPPDGVKCEDGMVWRLEQSIYGLKQAARDWYNLCSVNLSLVTHACFEIMRLAS
jgi:hypothetical protein